MRCSRTQRKTSSVRPCRQSVPPSATSPRSSTAHVRRPSRTRAKICSTAATRPGRSATRVRPGRSRRIATICVERRPRRTGRSARPHRAQARVAGHHRRPVPDRAQVSVRGDRRGARRRGDAEVAAAWDEVYWQMADTLIAMEKGALRRPRASPTATCGARVGCAERRQESADTVSFVLTSHRRQPAAVARPGQYLSVGVHLARRGSPDPPVQPVLGARQPVTGGSR